jgi:hypothetical protein
VPKAHVHAAVDPAPRRPIVADIDRTLLADDHRAPVGDADAEQRRLTEALAVVPPGASVVARPDDQAVITHGDPAMVINDHVEQGVMRNPAVYRLQRIVHPGPGDHRDHGLHEQRGRAGDAQHREVQPGPPWVEALAVNSHCVILLVFRSCRSRATA